MRKSTHLQVLTVQATYSAQLLMSKNILRLMEMVETPYFSEATVEKEKGIIAEEIKMYQEQPGYKLMFNTLRAMYADHPVRVDIAGSVESIYNITKDDLYLCYETFYHPSNMVMFVVGDVDPEQINTLVSEHEAKRELTDQPEIVRDALAEPNEVQQQSVTEEMNIQIPRLMLGFKNVPPEASKEAFMKRDLEMTFFSKWY